MLPASSRSEFDRDPLGLDVLTRLLVRVAGNEVCQTSGGGMVFTAIAPIVGVVCVMVELEGSQMPPVPDMDALWLPMRIGG